MRDGSDFWSCDKDHKPSDRTGGNRLFVRRSGRGCHNRPAAEVGADARLPASADQMGRCTLGTHNGCGPFRLRLQNPPITCFVDCLMSLACHFCKVWTYWIAALI